MNFYHNLYTITDYTVFIVKEEITVWPFCLAAGLYFNKDERGL